MPNQPEIVHIPAARGTLFRAVWRLTAGEQGKPVDCLTGDSASVQVDGTWGELGTPCQCLIDGTNRDDADPSFNILTDPRGNDLSFRGDSLERIEMPVGAIRPRLSGGDTTTDITITLLVRSRA